MARPDRFGGNRKQFIHETPESAGYRLLPLPESVWSAPRSLGGGADSVRWCCAFGPAWTHSPARTPACRRDAACGPVGADAIDRGCLAADARVGAPPACDRAFGLPRLPGAGVRRRVREVLCAGGGAERAAAGRCIPGGIARGSGRLRLAGGCRMLVRSSSPGLDSGSRAWRRGQEDAGPGSSGGEMCGESCFTLRRHLGLVPGSPRGSHFP